MMEDTRKIETIYCGLDFWAQGELYEGVLFLHCDVYQNSTKTLRKIKVMLAEFREEAKQHGYDKPIFTYTQNGRWTKLVGGVYHNEFYHEGTLYEMYKWE
jgi:hypothetical protein